MYSNSSAFLGGGNSARPGFPQQQNSFLQPNAAQQPGGYGQPQPQPLTSQFTGYPGQQYAQPTGQPNNYGQQNQFSSGQQSLQPSYTGFPSQQPIQTGYNQASQQPPSVPSQPQFQAPQPTGVQPPAQPLKAQMTSAQMADSFRGTSQSSQPPPMPTLASSKIPSIRLSFITAQDQAKFEQLFKSAAGSSNALSGDQARDILMRSKLDGNALSDIWYVMQLTTRLNHLTRA
jgi:hypothetical protein